MLTARYLLKLLILLPGLVLVTAQCAPPPTTLTPATQNLEIFLGEGETIEEVEGKDVLTGEFHRWEPNTLVVHKGDKVVLKIKNPRKNIHSFALPAYGIDTGPLEPRSGEKTVEFVADKAGVFQFMCNTAPNPDKGECDPDHAAMVGYLLVLEK